MTDVRMALEHLREALPRQRFFGEKSDPIRRLDLTDEAHIPVPEGPVRWWLLQVSFDHRASTHYSYFLEGDSQEPLAPERMGPLLRWLLGEMSRHESWPTLRGQLRYRPLEDLTAIQTGIPPGAPCRPVGVEQSNTSVILGERVIHKHFRSIQPGENPDVEMPQFLWSSTSFHQVPRPLGVLEYTGPGFPVAVLGSTQELERSDGDLWTVGLRLRASSAEGDESPLFQLVHEVGRVTASLHASLARVPPGASAFLPEPLDGPRLTHWKERWTQTLASAREALQRAGTRLEGPLRERAITLGARSVEFERYRDRLKLEGGGRPWSTRIHGDYHLGQVISTPRGFVILDFEGEPARPLSERREKHPPLRDVAGMVRSLDYLARAPLPPRPGSPPGRPRQPPGLSHRLQERFLQAYGAQLRQEMAPVEVSTTLGDPWLSFFVVEKALYEVRYELEYRPSWVNIPLGALEELLGPRPGSEDEP